MEKTKVELQAKITIILDFMIAHVFTFTTYLYFFHTALSYCLIYHALSLQTARLQLAFLSGQVYC